MSLSRFYPFLLAVCTNGFLIHDDLLNQRVEHFGGQFLRVGVLVNEVDPLVDVDRGLQPFNLCQHSRLFGLVLLRQGVEVVLRVALRSPVLIEP